jgi:midasin
VEELLNSDILSICKRAFPKLQDEQISVMLAFNQSVQNLILQRKIGTDGQPWEFNLRDVMRWCELVGNGSENGICNADDVVFLDLLYVSRFRSEEDRRIVSQLAVNMALLPPNSILPRVFLRTKLDKESFVVGRTRLRRRNNGQRPENVVKQHGKLQLLQSQSGVLEKLAVCVNFAFPVILVGLCGLYLFDFDLLNVALGKFFLKLRFFYEYVSIHRFTGNAFYYRIFVLFRLGRKELPRVQ